MNALRSVNDRPSIVIDGITVNVVQVVINAVDQTGGNPVQGSMCFEVNDIVWVSSANLVAAIDPVELSANGGLAGTVAVDLLAMDNEGFSTNWAWVLTGTAGGVQMQPRLLTVNYANGAQQTLSSLLDASTVVAS